MDITRENDQKLIIFYPEGLLDMQASAQLEKTLNAELMKHSGFNFIINMKRVDSICSSGIRVFISFKQKLMETGSDLCLTNINATVQEIFHIANIDQVIRIEEFEREAVSVLTEA